MRKITALLKKMDHVETVRKQFNLRSGLFIAQDFSLAEFRVLSLLNTSGELICDIAKTRTTSYQAVGKLNKRLIKRGYAEIIPTDDDRQRKTRITKKGQQAKDKCQALLTDILETC